jgi:hypothetical protein
MAEAFGVAASALTVIELTAKIISKCKHLIETAYHAPQDLRQIFIETSSLKAALESLHYLSTTDCAFSDTVKNLEDAEGAVIGCRDTITRLAAELDGLSLSSGTWGAPGKRQMIQGSLKWCLKETKVRKLLDDALRHKTTIMLVLLGEVT